MSLAAYPAMEARGEKYAVSCPGRETRRELEEGGEEGGGRETEGGREGEKTAGWKMRNREGF